MCDSYTGGLLNILNGKMGVSAPQNSVPVMNLINVHNPKSYSELEYLIEYHFKYDCWCGIKSTGTVRDFGVRLYYSQLDFFGEFKFSLDECVRWEYDLFVRNSLNGSVMEDKAIDLLGKCLPSGFCVRHSSGFVDECFCVDVEVFCDGVLVCGVQVKPFSYVFMGDNVKFRNVVGNDGFGVRVFYLFYDDDGFFMNLDILLCELCVDYW